MEIGLNLRKRLEETHFGKLACLTSVDLRYDVEMAVSIIMCIHLNTLNLCQLEDEAWHVAVWLRDRDGLLLDELEEQDLYMS